MSTATVTEAPSTTAAPATPEVPDWLDGATEVLLPTRKHLRAHWDAGILDIDDIDDIDDKNVHDTIIERADTFEVRFRVYLTGRLWNCIGGRWCFADWNGCRTRYIDLCVTVPPCTVPADSCGTLYQVGAKFELRCCGDYGDERVARHHVTDLRSLVRVGHLQPAPAGRRLGAPDRSGANRGRAGT